MPCALHKLRKVVVTHPWPPFRDFTMFCVVFHEHSQELIDLLACESQLACSTHYLESGRQSLRATTTPCCGQPAPYNSLPSYAPVSLRLYVPGGHHVLQAADVRVDSHQSPTFISMTLRGSKTDPFGAGCTLYVGCTQTHICPVTAVLAYLSVRAPGPGPQFCHADGTPLSRSALVTAVRTALSSTRLDLSRFSGHSFRIGAATTAAHAGLSDSLIQTLGRWHSSAFTRYIRTPTATLLSVSRTLTQHSTIPTTDPTSD